MKKYCLLIGIFAFACTISAQELSDEMREIYRILQMEEATQPKKESKWEYLQHTGYLQLGKIDAGKISELYRQNRIEGTRLTLPLRTNNRWSRTIRLGAFAGYGFGDEQWKYGVEAQFLLPAETNQFIGASYRDEILPVGATHQTALLRGSRSAWDGGSLTSAFFPIHRDFKLSRRQEASLRYERVLNNDLSAFAELRTARRYEGAFVPFITTSGQEAHFDTQSLLLNLCWSFGERLYLGLDPFTMPENRLPILNLSAEAGNYALAGANRLYAHLRATAQQRLVSPFGKLNYTVETGIIAGRVPFPLLQIARGNESYGIEDFSFTLMNYMEYAADTYAATYADYRFDRLLLGRVPILKALGMHELISAQATAGSLRNDHEKVMHLPAFIEPLSTYAEAGIGIGGILHLIDVQYVHRLTDTRKTGAPLWGIRVKLLFD